MEDPNVHLATVKKTHDGFEVACVVHPHLRVTVETDPRKEELGVHRAMHHVCAAASHKANDKHR